MGDISVMGRRLPNKGIQYGWSGNGGYMDSVGNMLQFYDTDEKVESLFSMGQLSHVGLPRSEDGGMPFLYTTKPANSPLFESNTERALFSKIAFIDFGYLRELDGEWYYVIPGPFRIKIPLDLIANNLDNRGYEFDYCEKIERFIVDFMFGDFYKENKKFQTYLAEFKLDPKSVKEKILESDRPMLTIFENYQRIYKFFDDWIVIDCDEKCQEIVAVYLKEKAPEEQRIETCDWFKPIPKIHRNYDDLLRFFTIRWSLNDNIPPKFKNLTSWDILLAETDRKKMYDEGYKRALEEGYKDGDDEAENFAIGYIEGRLMTDENTVKRMLQIDSDKLNLDMILKCIGVSLKYVKKLVEENPELKINIDIK